MNCEKGDLAVIYGLAPHVSDAMDRIVQCMELCEVFGKPTWVLDRTIRFTVSIPFQSAVNGQVFKAGDQASFSRLFDENLRPIRGDLSGESVGDEAPAGKVLERVA